MKIEDIHNGRTVYWAGVSWHRGACLAFVREGIILGIRWNKVEVQCPDGKRLLKKRERLHTRMADAQDNMLKLLNSRQPKRP